MGTVSRRLSIARAKIKQVLTADQKASGAKAKEIKLAMLTVVTVPVLSQILKSAAGSPGYAGYISSAKSAECLSAILNNINMPATAALTQTVNGFVTTTTGKVIAGGVALAITGGVVFGGTVLFSPDEIETVAPPSNMTTTVIISTESTTQITGTTRAVTSNSKTSQTLTSQTTTTNTELSQTESSNTTVAMTEKTSTSAKSSSSDSGTAAATSTSRQKPVTTTTANNAKPDPIPGYDPQRDFLLTKFEDKGVVDSGAVGAVDGILDVLDWVNFYECFSVPYSTGWPWGTGNQGPMNHRYIALLLRTRNGATLGDIHYKSNPLDDYDAQIVWANGKTGADSCPDWTVVYIKRNKPNDETYGQVWCFEIGNWSYRAGGRVDCGAVFFTDVIDVSR